MRWLSHRCRRRHGHRSRRHGRRCRIRHRRRCHRHYHHDCLPRHSPSLRLLPPWEPPANRQADAAVVLIDCATRYTQWTRLRKQFWVQGQVFGGGKASQRRHCSSACRRGGVRCGGARPPVPVHGAHNTVYGRSHRRPEGLHTYIRADEPHTAAAPRLLLLLFGHLPREAGLNRRSSRRERGY